jgi:NAD(P)-dependent dehydrogenase (short-subunit alcohol dehydrogenase family)
MATRKQILVTGGGTFLGDNIAAALLAEGAEVRLLVRPGAEDRLGSLADRTRWFTADVWDEASLKGRAREQSSLPARRAPCSFQPHAWRRCTARLPKGRARC